MITTITKHNKTVEIGKSNKGAYAANFLTNGLIEHTVTLVSYYTILKYAKLFLSIN